MKLHVFPPSPNSQKVLMVNALTGLNLPVAVVDLAAGAQKAPAFRALNPNGKVPVLEFDDGTTLWESNAIANRMAGMAKSDLWPASDIRYDILRWQFWEGCHWTPVCAPFLSRHVFGDESVDLDAAAAAFHPFARVLDAHLDGRDWLVGQAMTTADVSVAMILSLRTRCHMPVADYPNIRRWAERIEALPAFAATQAPAQAAE